MADGNELYLVSMQNHSRNHIKRELSQTNQMNSILETAIEVTTGERRRDYDKPSSNHERIANGWNWYINSRKDIS